MQRLLPLVSFHEKVPTVMEHVMKIFTAKTLMLLNPGECCERDFRDPDREIKFGRVA